MLNDLIDNTHKWKSNDFNIQVVSFDLLYVTVIKASDQHTYMIRCIMCEQAVKIRVAASVLIIVISIQKDFFLMEEFVSKFSLKMKYFVNFETQE